MGWTGGTFSRKRPQFGMAPTVLKGVRDARFGHVASFGNKATKYMPGLRFYWQSVASAAKCIGFVDGSTLQVCVTIETDGTLKVRRGTESGTVLCSSSSGVFTVNTWHHLQLCIVVHGSAGAVELRLNGRTLPVRPGINTSNTGNAYANKFTMYGCAGFNYAYYDDLWISDTAFQGTARSRRFYPSANGTTNNFNVSALHQLPIIVDETGDYNSDTDYTWATQTLGIKAGSRWERHGLGTVKGVRIQYRDAEGRHWHEAGRDGRPECRRRVHQDNQLC